MNDEAEHRDTVIPAKAGTHDTSKGTTEFARPSGGDAATQRGPTWVPAFAGMTLKEDLRAPTMIYQAIVFLPILGALIAGFFGRFIGARAAELVTSACLVVAAVLSWIVFTQVGLSHETVKTQISCCKAGKRCGELHGTESLGGIKDQG